MSLESRNLQSSYPGSQGLWIHCHGPGKLQARCALTATLYANFLSSLGERESSLQLLHTYCSSIDARTITCLKTVVAQTPTGIPILLLQSHKPAEVVNTLNPTCRGCQGTLILMGPVPKRSSLRVPVPIWGLQN